MHSLQSHFVQQRFGLAFLSFLSGGVLVVGTWTPGALGLSQVLGFEDLHPVVTVTPGGSDTNHGDLLSLAEPWVPALDRAPWKQMQSPGAGENSWGQWGSESQGCAAWKGDVTSSLQWRAGQAPHRASELSQGQEWELGLPVLESPQALTGAVVHILGQGGGG